ncbi:MAG: 50S ribosomal protein L31e [Candidatus Micrarchaeota archaeon]|nr:50S ribosomal protein L31e [Candidatus Micrarchaeota archaeon]
MEQAQQQIERPKDVVKEEKKPVAAPTEKLVEKPEPKTGDKVPAKEKAVGNPVERVPAPISKEKIEAKKEAKKAEKEDGVKKSVIVLKRNYVIPLVKAYAKPAKKRAAKAIKMVRAFAARHFKTSEANVKIDEKIAHFINVRGSKKPPKKLSVSLTKDKEGIVRVSPA